MAEFKVVCEDCGTELKASWQIGQNRYGDVTLQVGQCQTCMDEVGEKAHAVGFEAGKLEAQEERRGK